MLLENDRNTILHKIILNLHAHGSHVEQIALHIGEKWSNKQLKIMRHSSSDITSLSQSVEL